MEMETKSGLAIGSKVVVKPKAVEEQTSSGLFLPDFEQEKQYIGIAVEVGPGYLVSTGNFVPLQVGVGDTVLYYKQAGREFESNGETYFNIEERDLITYFKKKEDGK